MDTRLHAASGFSLYRYSVSRNEAVRVRDSDEENSWYRALPRPGGGYALLAGPAGRPESLFVAGELSGSADAWLGPGEQIHGVDWAPSGRSIVASVDGQLFRVGDGGGFPVIPRMRGPDMATLDLEHNRSIALAVGQEDVNNHLHRLCSLGSGQRLNQG